ncbi:MAG: T9SS type A sorting domain-containing protein [Ignavibacteriales bacterium]|nr:T9SS type A sorting domain-containing protein [Ignavibacteriales bacterium]
MPKSFITAQNYPNPFNPSTVISFTVPLNSERANTKLTIYNIQGEVIKELVNENLSPGSYLIRWNGDNKFGNNVSSGVYFYEVRNGTNKFVGKMNLMK